MLDVLDAVLAKPEFSGTASEAAGANLFGDGTPVRLSQMSEAKRQQYNHDLFQAAKLLESALKGNRRSMLTLQENLQTRSDFTHLMGDILDRQLLAQHQGLTPHWRSIARKGTVPDFRTVKRKTFDHGGDGTTAPEVGEGAPYPKTKFVDDGFEYAVTKKGLRWDVSFEALINDDLDAFARAPGELAGLAVDWEDIEVTNLYVDSTGPHASLFVADADGQGTANIIPSNPAFSIEALEDGFTQLTRMKRPDGRLIVIKAVKLVVPPALMVPAKNVLNALTIEVKNHGGTTNQTVIAQNWMKGMLELVVNPWIPQVATTNGDTSWFMFADPDGGRSALEFGFLRGYEAPQLFKRAPDATRVGGGDEQFGFEDDSVAYKLRHIFGGTRLDKRYAVASDGSGV